MCVCASSHSCRHRAGIHTLVFCASGSASNCQAKVIVSSGYSAGQVVRIDNGRGVRRSTDKHSCPTGYKIWSPRNKNDWTRVYNALGKNIKNYPQRPHLIVDVTRPANGCGGCTRYAMRSSTSQQGSWRTTDGSAWWLRDGRYNEPNGDYHTNCYLHIYDVNPNNVRFNDGSCSYYSSSYLCQPKAPYSTSSCGILLMSCNLYTCPFSCADVTCVAMMCRRYLCCYAMQYAVRVAQAVAGWRL